jgi:hypothetical protein
MRMKKQREENEGEEIKEEGKEKDDRYVGYGKWKEFGQKTRMTMMGRGSERAALFLDPLSHCSFSLSSFLPLGLFRKHMMGKRVNYCCRSVISPDPYLGTYGVQGLRAKQTFYCYLLFNLIMHVCDLF